jgi:glycerol-3-phosphate acyltransferase PlsY
MNGGQVTLILFGAYLLGSFPEAWLLARLVKRQDLRAMGSGNVGVMNTALSVSRWAGLIVALSEAVKGILVGAGLRRLGVPEPVVALSIVCVVIGVRWPVWLRFKGGRGNTAGMAALLVSSPQAFAVILAVWCLARLAIRRAFQATRLTLIALAPVVWLVTRSPWLTGSMAALSLIYLSYQEPQSDDHLILQQRWQSFWKFLISPPRR